MKSTLLPHTMILSLSCFILGLSSAGGEVASWTNREGTTIWADLKGISGDRIILHYQGREYRVPVRKLTPESVDKASRLLGLPRERMDAPAFSRETVTPPPSCMIHPKTIPSTLVDSPDLSSEVSEEEQPDGSVLPPKGSLSPTPLPVPPSPPSSARPSAVCTAILAGNNLQNKTYKWGGGRARLEDSGYDCSGSVSYVLIKAGLLRSPLTSRGFTTYGVPGAGRWLTIYARNGHVFMTVCGIRLDTGGHRERGPRWCRNMRSTAGFVARHPAGL